MYPFHLQARKVRFSSQAYLFISYNARLAQYMDLRIYYFSLLIPFRIWLSRCAHVLAMGVRGRYNLRRTCVRANCFVRRRNVTLFSSGRINVTDYHEHRMYDRALKPIPEPPTTGLRYRIETLFGITGIKMAKFRASWYEAISSPIRVLWRPQLLSILFFEVSLKRFVVGSF